MRMIPPRFAAMLIMFTALAVSAPARASDFDVQAYVEKYRLADSSLNGGAGYALLKDSGNLAWGESYVLNDYYMLWSVTKDPCWIDKMMQHIDMMLSTMAHREELKAARTFSDKEIEDLAKAIAGRASLVSLENKDANGYLVWPAEYPGWASPDYSTAAARLIESKSQQCTVTIDPPLIKDLGRAKQVTGHDYHLVFYEGPFYAIGDYTADTMLVKWKEYRPGEAINDIPGFSLKVEWTPKAQDEFVVRTIAQRPLQFVVHDGAIIYPMARFIEAVKSSPELQGRFGSKAESYLKVITGTVPRKWEPSWTEFPETSSGSYRFLESPAELYPGSLLPLNQNNAMGRALLVLSSPSLGASALLADKAKKIARYFKNYLLTQGTGWYWNYGGVNFAAHENHPEDAGHAITDVGFAIEAYHRGVEFTREDMVRFAKTLLDTMWNGSLDSPQFGGYINNKGGDGWNNPYFGRHWIELCEFDPAVWDACSAWFKTRGEPVSYIPSLLYAQDIYRRTWKKTAASSPARGHNGGK
ncbi:MAG: hypothetical protein RDV48_18000 [Candidatus Eremiobacteraeota bacterium]|nr:hypothetical protein [Candidatus Eremiobacteraeota bacterium]